MMDKQILEIAILAAKAASGLIMEVYGSPDFNVEVKGDQSPLTKADKLAHKAIDKILGETNLPVLSEEGKNIPFEERKEWEYFWLVDPLDGTKEFIKRNGEFTVNIALIHKNRPVWGVVYVPVQDICYHGGPGGKAWKEQNGICTELIAKDKPFDSTLMGTRVVASRSHRDENTNAFLAVLNDPVVVSMGSSLKFMMLAEGKADVYPRFAPTMEWDTAASHAVLNALGWEIFKEGTNEPLRYNKENLLNPGFLVK